MTNLSQTASELQAIFSTISIDALTKLMNSKERTISREQIYIEKCGEYNDKNSDSAWENYKIEASDNLIEWDAMKAARDILKAA